MEGKRMGSPWKKWAVCATTAIGTAAAVWAEPTTKPAKADHAVQEQVPAPRNIRFDSTVAGSIEVVRATSGHLLVHPMLHGGDGGWFIFDTGAGITCIDKGVAEKLGLPSAGDVQAVGMGGAGQGALRMVDSLQLGPVIMEGAPALELDLRAFEMFMGRPISGVVGYEMFGAAVYEVDFAAPSITLHDPATYQLPGGAAWSDMQMIRRRPYLHGKIEGNQPGLFVLDIGSNSALIVHSPTVKRFNLLDGRDTTTSMTGGVGGMRQTKLGRVTTFTLSGHELRDVKTTFSEVTEGAMTNDDAQGTVGTGVLGQFKLVINYPQQKIALIRK
jgi:predicted aspartyl protease